jgi:hypothetical protein
MINATFETGFELHPIQRVAAVATASLWRDVVVSEMCSDGWIELVDMRTEQASRVWHFEALAVTVGEPVSLHARYDVLAVGRDLFSVRVA